MDDFAKLFNGNPAMQVIWADALERIEKNEQLSPVQLVVAREWLHLALARINQLQLRSQHGFLKDEEYIELQTLASMAAQLEEIL